MTYAALGRHTGYPVLGARGRAPSRRGAAPTVALPALGVRAERLQGDPARIAPGTRWAAHPAPDEDLAAQALEVFRRRRRFIADIAKEHHFRAGRTDVESFCSVSPGHGRLDPERHFGARAIGDSMDGGKHPLRDGDYLLLELMDPVSAGSVTGDTLAIERQSAGDDQYLLSTVIKTPDGRYILKAANPAYPDYEARDDMRSLALFKAVLAPEDLQVEEAPV